MKTFASLIGVVVIIGLAALALADNHGYIIQAPNVAMGILADGNFSDWPSDPLLDIKPIEWYDPDMDMPENPNDLTAKFTVAWAGSGMCMYHGVPTEDTLYVRVRVLDQDPVFDASSWDTGDRVEIYTDFKHEHGEYTSPYGKQQWVLIPNPANPGRVWDADGSLSAPHNPDGTVNLTDLPWGVTAGYSVSGDTSFYELAIPNFPGSLEPVELYEGKTIGVDVSVCDRDTTAGMESFSRACWSPGADKAFDASKFGNAFMVFEVGGPLVSEVSAWFEGAPPEWEWIGDPGDSVWVKAKVVDPDGVNQVTARIDTGSVLDLQLFDDGVHNDGAPGDDVYGNFWETRSDTAKEYHVSIHAEDTAFRVTTYCDAAMFSTMNYPPEVRWVQAGPDPVLHGGNVFIQAEVKDVDGVDSVSVDIYKVASEPDSIDTIPLHDDGVYPDKDPGDDVWSAMWTTPLAAETRYRFDLYAEDASALSLSTTIEDAASVEAVDVLLGTPDQMGMITAPGDTTVTVPVWITDVTGLGVLSVEFELDYNSDVLSVPDNGFIQTLGTLTEGWAAAWDTLDLTPGPDPGFPLYHEVSSVRIAMAGIDSLDSAGLDSILLYLIFDIAEGAHHGDETGLPNRGLLLNEPEVGPSAGWREAGVTIGEYGDPSRNGTRSPFDASLLLMHAVGIIDLNTPGRQGYAPGDSIEVYDFTADAADVTGNGSASAYDAAHILQYSVGLIDHFPAENPYWPWNGVTGLVKPVIPAAKQIALADMRPLDEGAFVLPITIDEMAGVLSSQITLAYDPDRWEAIEAKKAELTEGYSFMSHISDGKVRMAFAGASAAEGSGRIAEIRFRPVDASVDMVAGIEVSEVQLYEGLFPVTILSSIGPASQVPKVYRLAQCYPNPFNPQTTIQFDLPEKGLVNLSIYNTLGQRIRTLVDLPREAGHHSAVWDGRANDGKEVASGVYFYRIRVNDFADTKKMIMVK